jgi:hypothetical protein
MSWPLHKKLDPSVFFIIIIIKVYSSSYSSYETHKYATHSYYLC